MPAYLVHFRIALVAIAAFLVLTGLYVALDYVGIILTSQARVLIAAAVAAAIVAAFVARSTQPFAFYFSERNLPAGPNGVVAGAQVSGFCFVGLIGLMFASDFASLGFIVGWSAGFVLSAALVAPYLRKIGTVTLPDFLAERYDSPVQRLFAIFVVGAVGLMFLVAHINAMGLIGTHLTGFSPQTTISVGAAIVALAAILGGTRSITWFQFVLAVIALVAFVVPVTMISFDRFGSLLPQVSYGPLFEDIAVLHRDLALRGLADPTSVDANPSEIEGLGSASFLALTLAMMTGTVAMPYIAMRAMAAASSETARVSCIWALLVVFVLAMTAPAYAVLIKTDIYQTLIGLRLNQLPGWVVTYGRQDLIEICGRAATSLIEIQAACQSAGNELGRLRLGDIRIDGDILYVLFAQMTGLKPAIIALAAAGALAALMVSASGALIAVGHTFGHDLFIRSIAPNASTATRMVVTRLVMIAAAGFAAWASNRYQINTVKLVAWSFSLAGGALFAPMIMGIWWRRSTRSGALTALITGTVVTAGYIYFTDYEGVPEPLGISNLAAGAFGVVAALGIGMMVTSVTAEPRRRMLDFVDRMRIPVGETLYDERRRLRRQTQSRVQPTTEDAEA